jgi:TolA-binding protein
MKWIGTALLVVGLGISLASVPALGQQGKNQKEQRRKQGPVLDYQRFGRTRKIDIQMAAKRSALRKEFQALLQYEKNKKERPSILFRLAENYFEEAESYLAQAQELDVQLAKDPENSKLRKKIELSQRRLKGQEDKWRLDAIGMYKSIVQEFPDYPQRDQVMFYWASSLWDLERYKDALAIYKELITNYADSKFVANAYLAFGEYYFENAKLDRALMAYQKVAEFTEAEIYPYALYKQGWCYFNLHEWAKAKDMFRFVVDLADIEKGTSGRKIEIRKEALSDFTRTYSNQGSAEDAPNVFKKLAPQEAPKLLNHLASLYFGDGKDKKSIILYRHLIRQNKCSAEVPFFQGRIVDSASRVGEKRYTVKQVRKLVELFKRVNQCIKTPTPKQKVRLSEARELAEVTLRRLSSTWYKEAKETKQRNTFEYAQELFGDYLELFPNSKDAYDIRFVYAELLFHRLGRFERAAVEYSKIVTLDLEYLKKHKKFPRPKNRKIKKKGQVSPPGTYFCDSAFKAMQASREIMKKEGKRYKTRDIKRRSAKSSGKLEKQPIPKTKRRFIKAAEIFMDYCPKDQDILDVKYDIAKTYYDYYHLNESVKRFDEIVRDFPQSDLANYSANLILDVFSEKKDWDSLNTYARKYIKNRTLMKNKKLRAFLEDIIPRIAFRRIGGLERKLHHPPKGRKPLSENQIQSRVAFGYIKFYREFPKNPLSDEALFNAGIKYEQAERLDKARKARRLLIGKYPKSDLVPETIFTLAENYERLADFDRAATLYERYANTYRDMKGLGKAVSYKKSSKKNRKRKRKLAAKRRSPGKQKAKDSTSSRRTWNLEDAQAALLNAGIYREALHQFRRAIANRQKYVDLFPSSEDTPQVYYSLGLLYERLKSFTKAAEVFGNYSARYARVNLDRSIAAHMKRAMMLSKARKARMADIDREIKTTIALFRKNRKRLRRGKKRRNEAAEAEAHAVFLQAEEPYREYIAYRFTVSRQKSEKARQKHLQKQLADKLNRFKKVRRVYTEVAKRKQPEWTIGSLYKLGRAYENFAETFYRAPLPKRLTADQLDLYKSTLRSMGQPYEDKAVSHFKAAVEKGSELGFYSQYTQLSLQKLQHYRPGEYPRERLGFSLGTTSDPTSRSPFLVATWDWVKKRPDLLNEPPLPIRRGARESLKLRRPLKKKRLHRKGNSLEPPDPMESIGDEDDSF